MTICQHCGHVVLKTRGCRLPEDWYPTPEQLDWAHATRVDLDIQRQIPQEVEKFRDYWHAKPGKDGVKLDWAATWRNWIRNARAIPSLTGYKNFEGTAQHATTRTPAAHLPADPAKRAITPEQREANKQRLADMLGGIGR